MRKMFVIASVLLCLALIVWNCLVCAVALMCIFGYSTPAPNGITQGLIAQLQTRDCAVALLIGLTGDVVFLAIAHLVGTVKHFFDLQTQKAEEAIDRSKR
jgi:hypothetical protein